MKAKFNTHLSLPWRFFSQPKRYVTLRYFTEAFQVQSYSSYLLLERM
jgi:hypothetical protein